MTKRKRIQWMLAVTFAGLLSYTTLAPAQKKDSAEVELQAAIQKEAVDGDLKGAIEQFKNLAQSNNRAVAAQALLHMAESYQKLGDAESRNLYERIVREYGDQRETVSTAMARLGNKQAAAGIVARELWPGDGSGGEASLSADGRSVVTYGIRDIASGKMTKILPDLDPARGFSEWSILSPDSKQIAYAFCCSNGGYEIRISAAEFGARPRTVLQNPEFEYYVLNGWSLDGKSILATLASSGTHAQLAWVSVSDGKIKTLKSSDWSSVRFANLSPDGRFIAYASLIRRDSPESEIRIIASDASNESVLVGAGVDNASPVWTRDGSRIVFLSKRSGVPSLWSIPVRNGKADGAAELIRPNMANVRPLGFTQTGSLIYVQSLGNQNVFMQTLDPATGKAQGSPNRIVDTYVGLNTTPSWSPDGKSIAYISRREEGAIEDLMRTLVIRSVDTGQEKTISTLFRSQHQPIWFPDGQSILQAARDAQNHTAFYKVDLRTGTVQELANTGTALPPFTALSADGKIVYMRHPEKSNMLAAYDLATGRRTDINAGADPISQTISASPDGRKLAYAARSASGPHLYVTNTDGSEARDLFTSHPQQGFITGITWTRDNQWLYFAIGDSASLRGHSSLLWRISANGGAPEPLGLSASTVGAISVNPNGTRLVFGAGELERNEYWALDNLERTWKRSEK